MVQLKKKLLLFFTSAKKSCLNVTQHDFAKHAISKLKFSLHLSNHGSECANQNPSMLLKNMLYWPCFDQIFLMKQNWTVKLCHVKQQGIIIIKKEKKKKKETHSTELLSSLNSSLQILESLLVILRVTPWKVKSSHYNININNKK